MTRFRNIFIAIIYIVVILVSIIVLVFENRPPEVPDDWLPVTDENCKIQFRLPPHEAPYLQKLDQIKYMDYRDPQNLKTVRQDQVEFNWQLSNSGRSDGLYGLPAGDNRHFGFVDYTIVNRTNLYLATDGFSALTYYCADNTFQLDANAFMQQIQHTLYSLEKPASNIKQIEVDGYTAFEFTIGNEPQKRIALTTNHKFYLITATDLSAYRESIKDRKADDQVGSSHNDVIRVRDNDIADAKLIFASITFLD